MVKIHYEEAFMKAKKTLFCLGLSVLLVCLYSCTTGQYMTMRRNENKDAAISIEVIALFASMAVVFVLNSSNAASITKIFINQVIFLSIPYILSITGMVLYTRTKSNGKHTVVGLVCNLIALVISNLSIINAILVRFFK